MQYKDENSASTSVTSDFQKLFIVDSNGIRVVPLQMVVLLNYEFSEIKRLSTGYIIKSKIPNLKKPFQIGQEIQLTINSIYPIKGSEITNVYFVDDGRLKDLPSWMIFDGYNKQVSIYVKKESLRHVQQYSNKQQSNSQKNDFFLITQQVIVFETKVLIQENSFYFEDPSTKQVLIDLKTSKQIHITFKEKGIINQINQISSTYSQNEEFNIPSIDSITQNDKSIAYIRYVLQQSLVYSPLQVSFQSSLIIDISNQTQIIQSFSTSASIYIKINNIQARFTSKVYSGVLISISDQQDLIKIEGDIDKLNKILSQKLEIYYSDQQKIDQNTVAGLISVNDGINNEFQQNLYLNDLYKLVILKNDIQIQKDYNLQRQFDKKFDDSRINADSTVSIEFSFNTYSNVNFTNLILYGYLQKSDTSQELIQNQFSNIQFIPQQFKFYFKTSLSDFNKIYCFNVNATDTYSWVEDSFCVKVYDISFYTLFSLTFQILGPIVFFIKVLSYWNRIFNILFQKRNIVQIKEITENQKFVQKIIIVNDSFNIGNLFFKTFLNQISQKQKSILNRQRSETDQITIKSTSFFKESILQEEIFVCTQFKEQNENTDSITSNKKIQNIINRTKAILKKENPIQQQKLIQLSKYYKNNSINTKEFIKDMFNMNIKINYQKKEISTQDLYLELNDTGSVLFNCIKGLLTKQLLKRNKRSYTVYKYIKKYCLLVFKCRDSNWQYQLTKVIHSLNKKKYNQEQIIPTIQFKDDNLYNILKPLTIQVSDDSPNLQNNLDLNEIEKQLDIDLNLIKNTICEDTIGIINPTNSFFFPNCGQSIHLHEHNIKQIKSYMSNSSLNKNSIFNLFKSSYVPISLQKNQTLPSWLKIKFEKQLITIVGTPPTSLQDHSIKISLFNSKDCIIRNIILKYKIEYKINQLDFQDDCNSQITVNTPRDQSKVHIQLQNLSKFFQNSPFLDEKEQLVDTTEDLITYETNQKIKSEDKFKKSKFKTSNCVSNDNSSISDLYLNQMQRKFPIQNQLTQWSNKQDQLSNNSLSKQISNISNTSVLNNTDL